MVESNLGLGVVFESCEQLFEKSFPADYLWRHKLRGAMLTKLKSMVRDLWAALFSKGACFYVAESRRGGLGIFAAKDLWMSDAALPGTKVIGLTCKASQSLMLRMHKAGFDSFYSKQVAGDTKTAVKRKQSIIVGLLALVNHAGVRKTDFG